MLLNERSLAKRIYNRSPVPLQNLALSIEGWRRKKRRYGGGFNTILAGLIERESWPRERVLEFQKERLLSFVRQAAYNVPYYRQLFKEMGLRAEDIRTTEDYRNVPILKKKLVQAEEQSFYSHEFKKRRLIKIFSSGTTGTNIKFAATMGGFREHWAVVQRYLLRNGAKIDEWVGVFSGLENLIPTHTQKPPFWRVNRPGKRVYFSYNHISDPYLPFYLSELQRRDFPRLSGYPSTISRIAQYGLEKEWDPPSSLRLITTVGENLYPAHRQMMEQFFKVNIRQSYTMSEAVAFISECPSGSLHVDEDFAYVEFLPHPAVEGAMRIIGTNLSNPAFPLLRYDTGDIVRLSDEGCDCGHPGRVIKEIEGRADDIVITPSGAHITRLALFFFEVNNVLEAQFVQKRPDHIQINVVRNEFYSTKDERRIMSMSRDRFGPEMSIEICYMDQIPRAKSGKFKYIVSEINKNPE